MKKELLVFAAAFLTLTSCSGAEGLSSEIQLQSVSPVPQFSSAVQADRHTEYDSGYASPNEYIPLNYDEQKSVWISYIDLAPMITGKAEDEFKNAFSQACANIKELGCNTVYVHVRSFGDAYYRSEYYPWSKGITGYAGQEPDYDPLEIMVDCAHQNGLSFHAWINPLRCETEENLSKLDSGILSEWYNDPGKYSEYLVKVKDDERYWLNPAEEDVRELICSGAEELCRNYKIDGIHMDDYFYPTTEEYFDSETYVEAGASISLSDWRLDNCSKLVGEIYDTVKSVNKDILFGISPQGNIENNYSYMYADIKRWCSEEGYIDYIVPQIYFGYDNQIKPFEETAEEWSEIARQGNTKLVIGLAPYKIAEDEEFSENTGIISSQIKTSQGLDNYGGVALYNYINIFCPEESLSQRLDKEKALIKKALTD
ncbi:family 10 glycosylhydrolase [Ruminococcus sp. Marseille-P6503]|uniref:glycoside hydrolase family 10 protein n=1 Tax=Ruminococcus sp. Marseille-P6503 TaxID=2364796 RepID=UPI000F53ECBA|nr:family 10 glycosylhydrolase [Ruminococcus sp. Marseille-P6503]